MFRPITTLRISSTSMKNLQRNGYIFLEDITNNSESHKHLDEMELKVLKFVPRTEDSIDLLIRAYEKDKILISSENLNDILDCGFECGTMTELCGAPGSGKSQICFQVSIAVQLDKRYGGLKGKVVYIDTRNGFSPLRLLGKSRDFLRLNWTCLRKSRYLIRVSSVFP